MASTDFSIVTRSGIDYSYWPICSEVLTSTNGNCKVNRYGKTLSRLFARIFPTCSPISTKSNLAGQESLVCRASDTRFAGECSTDYFKISTCSSFFETKSLTKKVRYSIINKLLYRMF